MRTDLDFSTEAILTRIKDKCLINDNGCWVWTGSINNRGRPICSIKNKTKTSYKHAYEAYHNKSVLSSVYLCHSCDNSLCCNPEHLFEGDNRINQLDYLSKFETNYKKIEHGNKCPTRLDGLDRLNWYKNNAIEIDEKGCWNWRREVGADNYGRVKYKGKKHQTHRLLWALYNNKVDELDSIRDSGRVIRHLCANKTCCNPEHLTTGSRSENAIDSMQYSKAKKYDENIIEWLFLYEFYINEGGTNRRKFSQGLRQLGLVSDNIKDAYVIDVLRGKSYKHLHKEFFDWTPKWR